MGFRDQWAVVSAKAMADVQTVFVNAATAAHDSIVNGSAITGAPALPGEMGSAVQLEFSSPTHARISTNLKYAQNVEDNLRGVTFRSGGAHGWKLTTTGYDRLVAVEAAKLGFR